MGSIDYAHSLQKTPKNLNFSIRLRSDLSVPSRSHGARDLCSANSLTFNPPKRSLPKRLCEFASVQWKGNCRNDGCGETEGNRETRYPVVSSDRADIDYILMIFKQFDSEVSNGE